MPVCIRCMVENSSETRICYNCGRRIHPLSGVRGDTPREYWPRDEGQE